MPENPYQNTNFENLINQVRENASPAPLLNTPDAHPTIDVSKLNQSDAQDYLNSSLAPIFKAKESPLLPTPIKATDIDISGRFSKQAIGWDNEDIYGQIQSNWDKAFNGLVKGLDLAGTTFLQGTVGLALGVGAAIGTGELNKLYNNEFSNAIDKWNKTLENQLPNYYTARERSAEWWEPSNVITANFFWDKFVKNLGFSLGALYSGGAVAKVLKLVPEAFSLSLTKNAIQAADAIEQAAATANPLSKTNAVSNAIKTASQGVNRVNSIVSPIDRFVVSTLGAVTEGGIEALQGVNEYRNNLIEDYKNKNGFSPTGEDLTRINDYSSNLGNARFGLNMLLLTGTNYVMLPKILGSSYSTSKALANGVETTLNPIEKDAITGLYKSALPASRLGKAVFRAKNISELFFSPVEAFEETSQYAIEKGVQDYYNKAYKGQGHDFIESIGEGYKHALSDKEGLESLLIGGLSGGIQQAGIVSTKGLFKSGNIAERGFTGYGGEREKSTTSLINALNSSKLKFKSDNWLKDLTEASARGINLQLEGDAYIRQGDVLEAKDNEFDYIHNYLTPRIKYGRYDLVKDDLTHYKQLALTDFDFLQQNGIANENDTPATFLQRLSNFEAHADNVESLYKSLNLRYAGLVSKDTKERIYTDEVIDKMVYASSKVADYDQRTRSLSNNLSVKGIDIFPVVDSILKGETTSKEATKIALEQINNLPDISEIKDNLKQELQDVIELSLRRKGFLNEYDAIKKDPKNYVATPVDEKETTATIKQRNEEGKSVSTEVELNKAYAVKSEPLFRDGNKLVLNPTLTVKNKTLGGEYEVILPDGTTEYLKPNELKDYSLSTNVPIQSAEIDKIIEKTIHNVLSQEGYKDVVKADTPLNELLEFVNILNNNQIANKIQRLVRENTKSLVEQLEKEAQKRAEFEANKKLQEALAASQKKTEQTSGTISTPEGATSPLNDDYAKKPLYNFLSSESMYEPAEMKLHQKLRNNFLRNFDSLSEQQQSAIRVITVTRDNEDALGLKGIVDYALAGYTPEQGEFPILKLYITTEGNKRYLIKEDGEKINTPLGQAQDYNEAVLGIFHEPNFGTYKFGPTKGQANYSKGTPEQLVDAIKAHKAWRDNAIAAAKKGEFLEYEIGGISRGIAETEEGATNPVIGTLAHPSDLNKLLIQVPTKENDIQVKAEGKSLNFPIGQAVFVNGNTIEPLNNRQFTPQEADNLYQLIHKLAENARKGELSNNIISFLKGVLYWRTPEAAPGRNQIWIDQQGNLRLGNQAQNDINTIQFTPESITQNKPKLMAFLTGAYNNVNNIKIKDLQHPFIELSVNSDGTIKEIEHPNYQSFLLTTPFLTTNIRKLSSSVPNDNNYRYKYSTLKGKEFEQPQPVKKEEAPKKEAPKTEATVSSISIAKNSFSISYTTTEEGVEITSGAPEVLAFLKTNKNSDGKLFIDALKEKDPDANNEDIVDALIRTLLKNQVVKPVVNTEETDIIKQEIERLKKEIQEGAKSASDWKDSQFRMASTTIKYSPIDIQKELTYISTKTPFSTEILNDIIKTPDGMYAWGKYKQLVISLYNKAQEGTGYHEAFEGVWDVFTTLAEKQRLISEFTNRQGTFLDRTSGSTISYKAASQLQAKEQIADEFADYVINNTTPPRAKTSLIERFFRNIWNFIKSILSGEVQTIDQIFSKIDAGYYKSVAFKNAPSNENQYSRDYRIGQLDFTKTYQITRGMVSEIIQNFLQDSKSLVEFDENEQTISQLYQNVYARLEDFYTKAIFDTSVFPEIANNPNLLEAYYKIWKNIDDDWDNVKQLTDEYLKLFSIVADENTDEDDNDSAINDNADRNDYFKDVFKVDGKKNAAKSIKLLISTISEAAFDETSQSASLLDGVNDKQVLSVRGQQTGMQQLVNFTKTFNNLLANLHTYNTLDEKLNKLDDLRKTFPNYQRLWKRLNSSTDNLLYDWKLKTKFHNVFSKQKPEAVIMYIQPDGSSYSGKANIQDTIAITVQGWIDSLKQKALSKETDLVKYDDNGNFFLVGSKLKSTIGSLDEKLSFLSKLDIPFTKEEFSSLTGAQKEAFSQAVAGLHKDLTNSNSLNMESSKSLNAVSNFSVIAESKIIAGADYDSVFPNLEKEFVQTFVLPNTISKDVNNINSALTFSDLLKTMPQLQAPYTNDSIYKNDILFKDGKRTDVDVYVKYIQGTIGQNHTTSNDKLSAPFRLIQEINQNLLGTYYVLLPADGSTEWMLQLTNPVSYNSLKDNPGPTWNSVYNIFNKYLQTENELFNSDGKHRLLSELSNKYTASEEQFKENISSYITNITNDTFNTLSFYDILSLNKDNTYKFNNIDKGFTTSHGLNFEHLTENQAKNILKFRTINAIINNIEIQKLFFGDVAEYSKAKDSYDNRFKEAFKRYKSFLSPRESSVYGSEKYNKFLNESNKVGSIQLAKADPGYFLNTDIIPTVTLSDVITISDELAKIDPAFSKNNATDAQAWSPLPAYRAILNKSSRWTDKHETVFQYRMAQDRLFMEEDGHYKYNNEKLKEYDKQTVSDYKFPDVYFPVLKPIVSGHSNTNGEWHTILDKDSVVPLSYSSVRGTNMSAHYLKMIKQGIGYAIVESGRKVGNKGMDSFYNEDGSVNNTPYTNLIDVRYEDFGIQQETSGKKNSQTRGSQLTKLAVLNLFDTGISISPEASELVKENIALLTEQTDNGYNRLLKNLGIVDRGQSFEIEDKSKVLSLLRDELLKREVTTNIKEALNLTEGGEFLTSFEALPNYRQIKNILFSYVEKFISRPQVSGGPKVQVSGALTEKGDDKLKFYSETNPKMEVLLPFHSSQKLRKAGIKFKDEHELLEIINSSPDAKEILSGVGFRIPTQELNSVDSFIIKGFLPEEMGDTIVVPEELTTKAGSDFDVDKLNTYLKNLYIDNKKQVRVVPYFGIGEDARKQLKSWLTKDVAEDFLLNEALPINEDPFANVNFEEEEQKAVDRFEALYAQSIENGYFTNLQKILALPQNFKRLVHPNSSDELISYRDKLVSIAAQEFDTKQLKSIINPLYVSQLRHIFLTGKAGVGIAAIQQTSNAVSQLSDIYIDPRNRDLLKKDKNEYEYILNSSIALPHNKNEQGFSTISKMLDKVGRYISDKLSQYINGFVDVAKDPFIIQIGANRQLAPIFMALERFGVPSDVVVYFMNQPIIREYMKLLDKKQNTFMYNNDNIKEVKAKFNKGKKAIPTEFNEKGLATHFLNNIDNYYNGKLTEEQNAEQLFVFQEFLKYSVIAQNLFRLTQGTNYDTARFTSDYSLVFKELQYQDAKENNIFSSSDKFMNSSFLGNTREKLIAATQAINTISPLKDVKSILSQIAADFKRNFNAKQNVGNLIEESYISHLLQTKLKLNGQLEPLILSTEKSVVNQFRKIRREATGDLANNILLTQLIPFISKRNSAKNIKPAIKPKDVVTKELYTEAFQELLDHPLTNEFARSLGRLAFLQSGVSSNILSMKEFLPLSIFTTTVNFALSNSSPQVAEEFKNVGAFYRNSWNNTNIVPFLDDSQDDDGNFKYQYSIPGTTAFAIHPLKAEARSKYLTLGRTDLFGPDEIRYKFLARRVDNADGEPIIVTTYNEYGYPQERVLFTAINAWGDGIRAQEYYSQSQKSIFPNGYIKVENELSNDEILPLIEADERAPSQPSTDEGTQDKINNCLG